MKKEKGQVVLIVLLVSTLMLTLGLSAARQTTVETKIDTDEELLKQAFNAAESGIDYYLGTGETGYQSLDSKSKADVMVSDIGGDVQTIDSGGMVLDGNPFLFWLVNHEGSDVGISFYTNESVGVSVCVDTGYDKALKLDYFYSDGGDYKVEHNLYNFNQETIAHVGIIYGNCVPIDLASGSSLLLVATPVGGQTDLTVNGSVDFPVQGQEITSVGRAGEITTTDNSVSTQISVMNRYEIPAFMLEAVTSGGGIN